MSWLPQMVFPESADGHTYSSHSVRDRLQGNVLRAAESSFGRKLNLVFAQSKSLQSINIKNGKI
jgi:hypothetical protein